MVRLLEHSTYKSHIMFRYFVNWDLGTHVLKRINWELSASFVWLKFIEQKLNKNVVFFQRLLLPTHWLCTCFVMVSMSDTQSVDSRHEFKHRQRLPLFPWARNPHWSVAQYWLVPLGVISQTNYNKSEKKTLSAYASLCFLIK